MLPVQAAGAYRYSIVPMVEDFARLNYATFGLAAHSELYGLLQHYYSGSFAFLVCIIDTSAKLRPFAYEYDNLANGTMFVPTRHFHPRATSVLGLAAAAAASFARFVLGLAAPTEPEREVDADWDHKIYSVDALPEDAGWYFSNPVAANELTDLFEHRGMGRISFLIPAADGVELSVLPVLGPGLNREICMRPKGTVTRDLAYTV